MTNDKGSIIVIVLMVLGVVSLMGVTLITQSRMDLQFSQSTRNYDRIFGSADGAASYALRYLRNDRRAVYCAIRAMSTEGTMTPGSSMNVPLPTGLSNCSARIILDQWTQSPGGSDPHKASFRIYAEGWSPVWGGAAGEANSNSIVEISVLCPIRSDTTCTP